MGINIIKQNNTITNSGIPAVIDNAWDNTLPSGYTRLEYIETTGSQYIDTGLYANQNYKMRAVFQPTVAQSKVYVGARNGSAYNDAFTINTGSSGNNMYFAFDGSDNQTIATMSSEEKTAKWDVTLDKTGAVATVLGNTYTTTLSNYTDFTCPYSILIGGCGGSPSLVSSARFYSVEIWENNVYVGNFIPAKRNSDSVLGMYDLVNNVFYTNAGTGTFTAGKEIQDTLSDYTIEGRTIQEKYPLPDNLVQVDYIESTGTQYIDTGVSAPNGFQAELRILPTSITTTTNHYIIGAHNSSSPYGRNFLSIPTGGNGYSLGAGGYSGAIATDMTIPVVIDFSTIQDNIYLKYNGVAQSVTIQSAETTRSSNSLYLFYENGYTSSSTSEFMGKVYYCKIWDNDTLVRNFIPVLNTTTNKYGMYDTVGKQFYGSASGTDFIGQGQMSANLFDKDIAPTNDGWYPSGGVIANASGTNATSVIPCKPNTTYSCWHTTYYGAIRFFSTDVDNPTIGSAITNTTGSYNNPPLTINTITTGANDKWLFLNYGRRNLTGNPTFEQQASDYVVVEGSVSSVTADDYIVYGETPAETLNSCNSPSPTNPVPLWHCGDLVTDTSSQYYGKYAIPITHKVTHNLPSAYEELESIESSGTQYIDTGVALSSIDKVGIKCQWLTTTATTGSTYAFGAYHSGENFGINKANTTGSYCVWGSSSTGFTPEIQLNTDYEIVLTNGTFTINGVATSYTPSATFTGTLNAYLFWANGTSQSKGNVRIYNCKFYNSSNTLTRNFIPAKRKSDSVLGMYDLITSTFYTNAGTGTFTGNEIEGEQVTIYANEPLRAVGDVKDTLNYATGTITRNVGCYKCTGTENWGSRFTGAYDIVISGLLAAQPLYCTHLIGSSSRPSAREGYCWAENYPSTSSCMLGVASVFSINDWKTYLETRYSNNEPVEVVYPLITATTESVTCPALDIELNNLTNSYEVESTVKGNAEVTFIGNTTEECNAIYSNTFYPAILNGKYY